MKTELAPDSPKVPRNRYAMWIDRRLQTKLVTAPTPDAAVEIVYTTWGISRSQEVVAKLKFSGSNAHIEQPPTHHDQSNTTSPDSMAFALGCTLVGWTKRGADKHTGLKTPQRMQLEEGVASPDVKATAWRALQDHGVPIDQLHKIATDYLAAHAEAQQLPPRPRIICRSKSR